ncbi:Uncharacterised protein [Chlamydia trachomatis]|nr:Uncharacterised protein [Chlamydia trachomatis]
MKIINLSILSATSPKIIPENIKPVKIPASTILEFLTFIETKFAPTPKISRNINHTN